MPLARIRVSIVFYNIHVHIYESKDHGLIGCQMEKKGSISSYSIDAIDITVFDF